LVLVFFGFVGLDVGESYQSGSLGVFFFWAPVGDRRRGALN